MAKIVVVNSVSLDGVTQGVGRADEDTRDGFDLGGWGPPYADAVMGQEMSNGMGDTVGMLFGRRTYEDFFSYWPHQTDNPYTERLNNTMKYVVSKTLTEPLPWQNSVLLSGDVTKAIIDLKDTVDGRLVVLGSGELVRALIAAGLVDELVLMIHPLLLGSGRRLFAESGMTSKLTLVRSVVTSTGVVIATYTPSGDE
jgi:dihydrofolate reductase